MDAIKGGEVMAKQRGRVTFNEDICKGCELCVSVCPVKILELDSLRLNNKGYHPAGVVRPEECIACLNCALICPDLVIKVEKLD